MTAATALQLEPRSMDGAVAGVVEWFADPVAYRKRHGLPRQDCARIPAPTAQPLDEQPCVDCGQLREHMLVFGLPGTTSRDHRRCLPCAELAR